MNIPGVAKIDITTGFSLSKNCKKKQQLAMSGCKEKYQIKMRHVIDAEAFNIKLLAYIP